MKPEPLRLREFQSAQVDLTRATREAVTAAAESWKESHGLPQPPLTFEGPGGSIIRAAQYVGVVEAGGACIEIYPKLDSLAADNEPDPPRRGTVMGNLLWLLERSGFGNLVDAGDASTTDVPDSISDLLAWLFARRLRAQIAAGYPREYVQMEDDLALVRGSIDFTRQSTVLFGRPDRIACKWDEFTQDIPLMRLLRCACQMLLARSRLPGTTASLLEALAALPDISDIHASEAIAAVRQIRWSRLNARWKPCYDLALAALRGLSRDIGSGDTESFVFLLDMNQLFESYCGSWLTSRTSSPIHSQYHLGHLFKDPRSHLQIPDFFWKQGDFFHIADAKYKRPDQTWPRIEDVRQLICYGQLAALRCAEAPGQLILLHPTTGDESAEERVSFDGSRIRLQAVRVIRPTGPE